MRPVRHADPQPVIRLALRLRTLRQFHGSTSLGQAQLAALAGIRVRQLRSLESTRCLPSSLRMWRRLADALHCSIDELIQEPNASTPAPVIGVVVRSDLAVAVCCTADAVVDIRIRGRRHRRTGPELDFAVQLARDYGAQTVVTDTDIPVGVTGASRLVIATTSPRTAAALIGLQPAQPRSLAAWALATDPRLARWVRLSPRTNWLAVGDRIGPRILLAAAIAFVYSQGRPVVGQLQLPLDT